ncbi:hypothetical protein B0I37DRAFT_433036, partial [Chaetomium sp. MPI-CAGE-AT-0009]
PSLQFCSYQLCFPRSHHPCSHQLQSKSHLVFEQTHHTTKMPSQTHTVTMDHVESETLKQEHHGQAKLHGCSFLGIAWQTAEPKSKDKPMPTVYACLGGATINNTSPDPKSAKHKLFDNIARAIDGQLAALHAAPVDVTYVYATRRSGGGWAEQHPEANAAVLNFIMGHFHLRRCQVNVRRVAYRNTNTAAGVTVSYYPHYYRASEGPVSIA